MHRIAVIATLAVAVAACSGEDTAPSADARTSDNGAGDNGAGDTAPRPTAVPSTSPRTVANPTDSGVPESDAGAVVATSAPVSPATSAPPVDVSPLAEYLPYGTGSSPDLGATWERWQRAAEDAKADCMAEHGFEYVPYVMPLSFAPAPAGGAVSIVVEGGPGRELPPGEYAAQYGYGLSTVSPAERTTRADPNDAIVDAMDVPERVAYFRTMFGASQSLDDRGYPNAEIAHDDPKACWQRAAAMADAAAPEPDADARAEIDAAFAGLREQIAALPEQVSADARVVAATQRWAECMTAAGYPGYTDLNGPQSDVAARARSLMGDALDPANAEPDALAELQRLEIGLAVADERCRESFGTTYQDVTREFERRFVEQHRAELEEYRDAIAALGQ